MRKFVRASSEISSSVIKYQSLSSNLWTKEIQISSIKYLFHMQAPAKKSSESYDHSNYTFLVQPAIN